MVDELLWWTESGWSIYLVTPARMAETERDIYGKRAKRTVVAPFGIFGATNYERRTIWINAAYSRAEQDETVTHELCHAFGEPANLPREDDEAIVTAIANTLHSTIAKRGARWPRRPRGTAALERRAREQ